MKLIKEIRESVSYKKYSGILERARSKIDLDSLRDEALGLHRSRTSRSLYSGKKYSMKYLHDALLKDLAFRARLVEIRVNIDIPISEVEEAVKVIRRLVITEYDDALREYSTSDVRKSFVDRVLKSGIDFIAEGHIILKVIDTLIKDLDQASHNMRNIVETLKLLDGSKSGKVL